MIDGSHALDRRRALLLAALGFCRCSEESWPYGAGSHLSQATHGSSRPHGPRYNNPETALTALRGWLSSWRGIGLVAAGMARQGFDLSLTRYADFGWRATFYVTGREHSPTGATGSAFEATPFRAVQVAAWETLTRT
jgi:hypothetical protein